MNKSFQITLQVSHSSLLSFSALNCVSGQEIFVETSGKQWPGFSTFTEPSSGCLTPRATAQSHADLNNVQVVPVFISQYKTWFLLNYFNQPQDLGVLQHCWLQHLQSCIGCKAFFFFFSSNWAGLLKPACLKGGYWFKFFYGKVSGDRLRRKKRDWIKCLTLLSCKMGALTESWSKNMFESVSGKWYGNRKRKIYKRCHKLKFPFFSHLCVWRLLYVD